jgi:hypothetical protein
MACQQTERRSRRRCWTRSTGSDRLISRQGWWRGISRSAHSPETLIAPLANAVLRRRRLPRLKDAGGGVRQATVWGDTDEARHILIAVARYLAAHSPTERAAPQTAEIAKRLMRGRYLPP